MICLKELSHFLGKATLATYAGGGEHSKTSQRPGFIELEYTQGAWDYRDSYAGFTRSVGHEVVWNSGQPCWSMVYGGGMIPDFSEDCEFSESTFKFLKLALSHRQDLKHLVN